MVLLVSQNISLHFQLEAGPYVFILGFIKLVSYLKNKRQNVEDHGNKGGFVKRVLFLGMALYIMVHSIVIVIEIRRSRKIAFFSFV